MRELPEPEASFHTSDSGQWVEGANGTDMFTRDQVLAIQRQAYEDGLRDAIECADEQWVHDPHISGGDAIRAMLTASQKEQK